MVWKNRNYIILYRYVWMPLYLVMKIEPKPYLSNTRFQMFKFLSKAQRRETRTLMKIWCCHGKKNVYELVKIASCGIMNTRQMQTSGMSKESAIKSSKRSIMQIV